jgi:hypothetical protein
MGFTKIVAGTFRPPERAAATTIEPKECPKTDAPEACMAQKADNHVA